MNLENLDSGRTVGSGANVLVAALGAQAVMALLSPLLVSVLVSSLGVEAWVMGNLLLWLVLDGVLLVGLLQLAAQLPEASAGLVRVTGFTVLAGMGFDLLLTLVDRSAGLGSVEVSGVRAMTLLYDVNLLLSLAARGLLLLCFVRLAGAHHPWVVPVVAVVALLTVANSALSLASMHDVLSRETRISGLFSLGRQGVGAFNAFAVLACGFALRAAVRAGPSVEAVKAAAGLQPAPAVPIHPAADFLVGGILLAVGVGVTMVSYSSASGGGRYVIATGAIGVGLVRVVRGLVRLGKR